MWSVEKPRRRREAIIVLKTESLAVNGVNARKDMAYSLYACSVGNCVIESMFSLVNDRGKGDGGWTGD